MLVSCNYYGSIKGVRTDMASETLEISEMELPVRFETKASFWAL